MVFIKILKYLVVCESSRFDVFDISIMVRGHFCSTDIQGNEPFLQDGSKTILQVESLGHVFSAFINGKLAGDEN